MALTLRNAWKSQKPPPTCLQDQKGPKQHLSLPYFKHDPVIQQTSALSPSIVSLQVWLTPSTLRETCYQNKAITASHNTSTQQTATFAVWIPWLILTSREQLQIVVPAWKQKSEKKHEILCFLSQFMYFQSFSRNIKVSQHFLALRFVSASTFYRKIQVYSPQSLSCFLFAKQHRCSNIFYSVDKRVQSCYLMLSPCSCSWWSSFLQHRS